DPRQLGRDRLDRLAEYRPGGRPHPCRLRVPVDEKQRWTMARRRVVQLDAVDGRGVRGDCLTAQSAVCRRRNGGDRQSEQGKNDQRRARTELHRELPPQRASIRTPRRRLSASAFYVRANPMSTKLPVLVLGAGPVGLGAALELARFGVRTVQI